VVRFSHHPIEAEEPDMSKARKTIVRHEDGTVSTRGSARAIYTHAVEVAHDMRSREAEVREVAAQYRADADALEAATAAEATEKRQPWNFHGRTGVERVTVYIGKQYLGAYMTNEADGIDVEAARVARVAELREHGDGYEERADALAAGPALTFSVYRWSGSRANAEKGARELDRATHVARVRIVEVEEA
jgi:hypothetical protein